VGTAPGSDPPLPRGCTLADVAPLPLNILSDSQKKHSKFFQSNRSAINTHEGTQKQNDVRRSSFTARFSDDEGSEVSDTFTDDNDSTTDNDDDDDEQDDDDSISSALPIPLAVLAPPLNSLDNGDDDEESSHPQYANISLRNIWRNAIVDIKVVYGDKNEIAKLPPGWELIRQSVSGEHDADVNSGHSDKYQTYLAVLRRGKRVFILHYLLLHKV
jgi:hypothetical protein